MSFKLTSATTSQVGLITASNKDALSTGKNACLAAVGNDIFLDFKKKCELYDLKLNTHIVYGLAINPAKTLYDATLPLYLEGDLNLDVDPLVSDSTQNAKNISIRKFIGALCFKNLEIKFGQNGSFVRDKNYGMKDGWYQGFNRKYYGNGMYTNIYYLPFALQNSQGVQVKYKGGDFDCRTVFYMPNDKANLGLNVLPPGPGIISYGFDPETKPNLCDIGISYKKYNTEINFDVQRSKSDTTNGITNTNTPTPNAQASLLNSNKEANYSYTLGCVSDVEGVQLSGSLSCVNLENKNNNNKERLLMWSLGCVSECKSLQNIPLLGKLVAQGINLSTPLYLQKNENGGVTDGTPLNCEINCLTQLCGLNVPIALNIFNPSNLNNKGSACIFTMRPYSLIDKETEVNFRNKLNCEVEGGIGEDE